MLPAALPEEIRNDPLRSAEVQVYDRLKGDPLLDGALVMYSCDWIGAHDGLLRDGEADFVVAHPVLGFLVLEVKGGRVSRRAADGKWLTRNRADKEEPIQDPIRQAMKSKKVILEALKEKWHGKAPFIRARHGVVLPHSWRPKAGTPLGASLPPELLACREDMATLPAKIVQMMAYAPPGVREPVGMFGPAGMALIEDFYGRDLEFAPRLKAVIEESESAIERLTATQSRYLDFLEDTRTALIEGGAGTGKTTLAVEKARRAAANGRRCLLLCFNRPLMVAVEAELAATSASVATFHEFCGRMCRLADIDMQTVRASCDEHMFWTVRLPELVAEIGLLDPPERYDVLIIDEGQDFKAEWVEALRLFLADGASLIMFRDDFQNIYGGADMARMLGVSPLRLSENVRNTQEIFGIANAFREGPAQRCLGPAGEPVRWVAAEPRSLVREIERQLNRLIVEDGVPPGDVAVLTGCAIEAGPFAEGHIGRHAAAPADAPRNEAVILDSVRRFKGLDRPVVILCAMENDCDLAYVGLSRARSLLIVAGDDACLERLGRRA
jgi:hypothetical protein